MFYIHIRNILCVLILTGVLFTPSNLHALTISESFTFRLKKVQMNHFWKKVMIETVEVKIEYKEGIQNDEYPNITEVERDLQSIISKYSHQDDYWEIVNKKIAISLMDKYKVFQKITITLSMPVDKNIPFTRISEVVIER